MGKLKKVFIGVNNTAGVCSRLKRGLNEIGVEADFYCYDVHVFSYTPDKIISYSDNKLIRKFQKAFLLIKLVLKYKYFIFVSPESILPDFKDIKFYKFFGKKVMMVFVGCDVRIPERVMQFKWNPCRECTQEYQDFVGCRIEPKKLMIRKVENLFDIIGCPVEAGGYIEKKWFNAIFPIDFTALPESKPKTYTKESKLKILHAPTNPVYKGSAYIYKTIDELKKKYDFEFKVVRNISIQELYKEMVDADLIIDQVLLGSYGFVTIESMALYRPAVCYIRDEIWNDLKQHAPIYNANPDTLYSVLENIITNPVQLTETAIKGRKYVEDFWAEKKVAKMFYEQFEKLN